MTTQTQEFVTSPKQNQSFLNSTHRFNIWVGAVRSGKTFSSIRKFIDRIKHGVPGDAMIIGVNRGAIQRNILSPMYKILGFPAPSPVSNKATLFGRDIHFIGAPDISAVTTIQGSTLAYAYVDEATCIPEAFWKMLESRLSVPGAQLFATANPEGPLHYLKKDYIDRPDLHDIITWQFNLDDNPVLDETYKKAIKSSYTGVFYKRFILGEWAQATGSIFDSWDNLNVYSKDYPSPSFYCAGIDYGTVNPTACYIAAISPNLWPQIRIEKEYYFDSKKYGRMKTDRELSQDIYEFLRYHSINALYVDPAAASLKLELRNKNLPVIDANNDVLFGIKLMTQYISGKNLMVHQSCKTLIEQCQNYAWCPKAAQRGEDRPIKEQDHAVDAVRYIMASVFKHGIEGLVESQLNIEDIRRNVYGNDGIGLLNPEIGVGSYF